MKLKNLMTKTVFIVPCLFAIVGIANPQVFAADGFNKRVFDATFKIFGVFNPSFKTNSPLGGQATMRLVSDGKGHFRREVHDKYGNRITIFDYLTEKEFIIMEKEHTVSTVPSFDPDPDTTDLYIYENSKGKPLGTRSIAGHICHGYENMNKFERYDVRQFWVGDDINYLVRSEAAVPGGKIIQTLQSWSTATPTPELFKVPPDYKTVDF